MRRASAACVAMGAVLAAANVIAAPVTVRFAEKVTHGGDRVDSRLVFRFKDGSLYDETAVVSQRRVFRLLTYRLVQRGPAFPEPIEVSFSRETGRYTARLKDDKPAEGTLTLPEGAGHLVAFRPKPQMLDATLREEGEDRYFVGDHPGTATRYLVKLEVPGVKGVVADLLGKTPPENRYWFTKGGARGFLKFEGAMFLKGPTWRIELAAPRWAP